MIGLNLFCEITQKSYFSKDKCVEKNALQHCILWVSQLLDPISDFQNNYFISNLTADIIHYLKMCYLVSDVKM